MSNDIKDHFSIEVWFEFHESIMAVQCDKQLNSFVALISPGQIR